MVDEDYRTWLIEVNTNPFLGTQNEWHGKLVSDMIEGFTQLTIDRLFPKPKEYKSNSDINTDLIHNWKLLYNKESNFLEVSLLPNSKREQLGVGADSSSLHGSTGGWRTAARVALRPYSPAGPMPGPVLSCLR